VSANFRHRLLIPAINCNCFLFPLVRRPLVLYRNACGMWTPCLYMHRTEFYAQVLNCNDVLNVGDWNLWHTDAFPVDVDAWNATPVGDNKLYHMCKLNSYLLVFKNRFAVNAPVLSGWRLCVPYRDFLLSNNCLIS